jgi:hypothetical protein
MDQVVPDEVYAEMAFSGHAVAHFPSRMQPKQCYDSLILNHAALGLGEGNSADLRVKKLWLGPVPFSKKLFFAAKLTPT